MAGVLCLWAGLAGAEPYVRVGLAPVYPNRPAFDGLIDSFVGGFTPPVQEDWQSIDLGTPGGSGGRSGVAVALQQAVGVRVGNRWPIEAGFVDSVLAEALWAQSKFYFTDGIFPLIDPIKSQISTFGLEIGANGNLGSQQWKNLLFATDYSAGISAFAVSSTLTSALLDVSDSRTLVVPFVGIAQSVGWRAAKIELGLRMYADGAPDFDLALQAAF